MTGPVHQLRAVDVPASILLPLVKPLHSASKLGQRSCLQLRNLQNFLQLEHNLGHIRKLVYSRVHSDDLKVPFIKDVIQEKSINHHDKLGNHSNSILQPLLEQQQRRRLKKLWPADLTDG
jgi:hypothetical protein